MGACNSGLVKVTIPNCLTELRLPGLGLIANTKYDATIKDKFGSIRTTTAFTDNAGVLFVDFSKFPEGFFSKGSGSFEFILYPKSGDCPVDLTITDTCAEPDASRTVNKLILEPKPIKDVNEVILAWHDDINSTSGYISTKNGILIKIQ